MRGLGFDILGGRWWGIGEVGWLWMGNVESSRRTSEARLVTNVAWTSAASTSRHHDVTISILRDMAEVQSQPAPVPESKVESKTEDKDALIVRLDELLEKYLHTLDEYQKSREQLSKQLSSVSYYDPSN
jgi:hypothetical protein